MTKGLWVYCPFPMFSKTCTFLYLYILSHLFSFCISGCISHTISNELFLQHYRAFPCTPFVPTFYIRLQYEKLFPFSCHTFYKVVIGLFIYLVFHIVSLNCLFLRGTQHLFPFNFQSAFRSPFHVSFSCCFCHFFYKLSIHSFASP